MVTSSDESLQKEAVKTYVNSYKQLNKKSYENKCQLYKSKFEIAHLFADAKKSLSSKAFKQFYNSRSIKIGDTQRKKYIKVGILLNNYGQLTVQSQLNFEKVYFISSVRNYDKLQEVVEFVCVNKIPNYNDNFFKKIINKIEIEYYDVEKAFNEAEEEYRLTKSNAIKALKVKERTGLKDQIEKLTLDNKVLHKENRTLREENQTLKEQLYRRYSNKRKG